MHDLSGNFGTDHTFRAKGSSLEENSGCPPMQLFPREYNLQRRHDCVTLPGQGVRPPFSYTRDEGVTLLSDH